MIGPNYIYNTYIYNIYSIYYIYNIYILYITIYIHLNIMLFEDLSYIIFNISFEKIKQISGKIQLILIDTPLARKIFAKENKFL